MLHRSKEKMPDHIDDMTSLRLRLIRPEDDSLIAAVIRAVMTEYACDGPGYSIHDLEVDHMYDAYNRPGAAFWVIASDSMIYGGGGYAILAGEVGTVCELKKMYFLPEIRGEGWGKALMTTILQKAALDGYTHIYLETVYRMQIANALYQKFGFLPLDQALGQTGHSSCDAYYLRPLEID